MAITYTLNTTEATTMKDFLGGDGGFSSDIVLTFDVAASTALEKGMILKLASGYATSVSGTTDTPIGICMKDVDNTYMDDGTTAGAAGNKQVAVLVRGMVKMNAFIADSGTYDDALIPGTRCGLSSDGTNVAGSCVSCGADPTVYIGTMLSTMVVGTGTAGADVLVLALVYVDLLGPSRAI